MNYSKVLCSRDDKIQGFGPNSNPNPNYNKSTLISSLSITSKINTPTSEILKILGMIQFGIE